MYASVENDSLSVGATFVIIDNACIYPFFEANQQYQKHMDANYFKGIVAYKFSFFGVALMLKYMLQFQILRGEF